MADDAGALLVRSGLVSASALDEARARVANLGGTLGEQLVTAGAVGDLELTEFYCTRLLVPQVNPNALARLTPQIIGSIPTDMAVELRAIPVSFDADRNLTVAMSDPSNRRVVDEISFFTGAYVVRAVATQMQIAWCLAHYYGHVTPLGQRLLRAEDRDSPIKAAAAAAAQQRAPRVKGLTGKVNATRHRAVAPVTGPVEVLRPSSGQLDLRPLGNDAAPPAPQAAADPAGAPALPTPPAVSAPSPRASGSPPPGAQAPALATPAAIGPPRSSPIGAPGPTAGSGAAAARSFLSGTGSTSGVEPGSTSTSTLPGVGPPVPVPAGLPRLSGAGAGSLTLGMGVVPRAAPDATTLPPIGSDPPTRGASAAATRDGPADDEPPSSDAAPDELRTRSVSGEIRVPVRRAPSIRPPLPAIDDDEPVIVVEKGARDDDATGPRKAPPRRRIVKTDPPELRARAGEVDLKDAKDRAIDADEPRIVIDEDAFAPPTARIDTRGAPRESEAPRTAIDVIDDAGSGAVIHDRIIERESQPILLDRPRGTPDQFESARPTIPELEFPPDEEDEDTGEIIVVLDARNQKHRPERHTQVGVPPAPVSPRAQRDAARTSGPATAPDEEPHTGVPATAPPEPTPAGVPTAVAPQETERTGGFVGDATKLDLHPAPPGDETASDLLAAPPSPDSDADTNPHMLAAPPRAAPSRPPPTVPNLPAMIVEDRDDDDLSGPRTSVTSVMSAAELDDAIPHRTAEVVPGHLARRRIDYDPIDDGWGPPGTTIPPPLLGAIPGSESDDDEAATAIPMPNIDSSPLIVGPQVPSGDAAVRTLARALEEATARAIEVIRELEHAQTRDQVVEVMISHLAETHHRAGFLVTRHAVSKDPGELGLFAMTPKPPIMPFATLRLDRPSTMQDVVGTRLPYRGPMHDDASRGFLIAILGACPPEILLVPVAVRERVVGVLFGEHRQRHTFDDQLALAARAAGMALERILKARRG